MKKSSARQNDILRSVEAKIEFLPISTLKPYEQNARVHSKRQVREIARSIERFGFTNPVLIDGNKQIICGHGRLCV